MNLLFAAVFLMAGTGLILGIVIALFARFFKVPSNERLDLIVKLLPGANCGGCGKAGCSDFARSVLSGENPPGRCPVSSAEQINAISLALGLHSGEVKRRRAVVFCGGDHYQKVRHLHYNGVTDCNAAALVAGGPTGCLYGCLGMGSCANVCPFGAIEIVNNIALVHAELCVGCGKCTAACPRGVIRLVSADAQAHVYCSSPQRGAEKRKNCKVGCIGCGKCAKLKPDMFDKKGFLAQVNYENGILPGEAEVKEIACPAGALLTSREHHRIERGENEEHGGERA